MKPIPATRFRRGPDRRRAGQAQGQEARQSERRREGVLSIKLFSDADERGVEEALADSDVLALPAGTPLLRRGESNRDIFVLLSGKLVIQLGDDATPEHCIEVGRGECIGEISAIDGKPITALVFAGSDARVLRIDRDVFWNRLMLLPGVARNLMGILAGRMRRANEKSLGMLREQLELQHLRKELEVARELQASMLPLQRPLFPGRPDIQVCGFMVPASKVGGDLFDAFFIDNETLFVCIGDVSGHGIAAALLMARVIGLLRVLAMETTEPQQILATLNDRLCSGNSTNLFVTLFCGFLDVGSGRFVYSNGGHCPPMVCREGQAAMLPVPKGLLLGVASRRKYSSLERILPPGETLLCYTDGVTEAEDPDGTQFSHERALESLRAQAALDLPELLDAIHGNVVAHCGTPSLADDCTMLALRRPFHGPDA